MTSYLKRFDILHFVTSCDEGRGSKHGQNRVTLFMDGPMTIMRAVQLNAPGKISLE